MGAHQRRLGRVVMIDRLLPMYQPGTLAWNWSRLRHSRSGRSHATTSILANAPALHWHAIFFYCLPNMNLDQSALSYYIRCTNHSGHWLVDLFSANLCNEIKAGLWLVYFKKGMYVGLKQPRAREDAELSGCKVYCLATGSWTKLWDEILLLPDVNNLSLLLVLNQLKMIIALNHLWNRFAIYKIVI